MIGVTIGSGKVFGKMAELAARNFTSCTGLPAHVIGKAEQLLLGLERPHDLKFELFNLFPGEDAIAFFDADLIWLSDFEPREHFGDDGFAAVRDLFNTDWILCDSARAGVRPQNYFNSGFFLIDRTRASILDEAKRLKTSGQITTPFKDQTFLNAAADRLGVAVQYLPQRFNFHIDRDQTKHLNKVIGAHFHWLKDEPDFESYYDDPHCWIDTPAAE